MSTKLYNGMKAVNQDVDVFTLCEQVAGIIRPVFIDLSRELAAEEIINSLTGFKESQNERIFNLTERQWVHNQQKTSFHSVFNDPLHAEVSFGRTKTGVLLAYGFFERNSYRKALLNSGLFTDYHYQNQTDRPDDVGAQEWKQRSKDWDSLLNVRGTFEDLPQWGLGNNSRNPFNALLWDKRENDKDDRTLTVLSGGKLLLRTLEDSILNDPIRLQSLFRTHLRLTEFVRNQPSGTLPPDYPIYWETTVSDVIGALPNFTPELSHDVQKFLQDE